MCFGYSKFEISKFRNLEFWTFEFWKFESLFSNKTNVFIILNFRNFKLYVFVDIHIHMFYFCCSFFVSGNLCCFNNLIFRTFVFWHILLCCCLFEISNWEMLFLKTKLWDYKFWNFRSLKLWIHVWFLFDLEILNVAFCSSEIWHYERVNFLN